MQAVDSNAVADPHLHRHRAAARHLDRLQRHDLRFRQHARHLHRDRHRDRHEGSLGIGHVRVVRRAVAGPSVSERGARESGTALPTAPTEWLTTGRGSTRMGSVQFPRPHRAPARRAAPGPHAPHRADSRGAGRDGGGGRRALRGLGRGRRPVRRHRGGGARHRLRGELRHRRPGRRLQRHLRQRLRQRLPLGRDRPRGHRRHRRTTPARAPTTSAGRRPGSGSTTPSTSPRPAPTRSRSGCRRRTGSPTRCTSPTSSGTNLSGSVADPQHRRLRDLDHGRRQRHAAGRAADADGSTRTPTAGTSTTWRSR